MSDVADPLEPYRQAFDADMRTLAARSRTPLRLLNPNASRWHQFTAWARSLRHIFDRR